MSSHKWRLICDIFSFRFSNIVTLWRLWLLHLLFVTNIVTWGMYSMCNSSFISQRNQGTFSRLYFFQPILSLFYYFLSCISCLSKLVQHRLFVRKRMKNRGSLGRGTFHSGIVLLQFFYWNLHLPCTDILANVSGSVVIYVCVYTSTVDQMKFIMNVKFLINKNDKRLK